MPRTRRRFTSEFKAEAVKLLEESGRSPQMVADELGVHANQLRTWRNERLAAGSAEALAQQKTEAAELVRLRREVKRERWLNHRVLAGGCGAVLDAACAAWNALRGEPGRLRSLTSFPWLSSPIIAPANGRLRLI